MDKKVDGEIYYSCLYAVVMGGYDIELIDQIYCEEMIKEGYLIE